MSKAIFWDDQQAFLAVFDTGSLSAAARKLGIAQPTIRARIASLEHALGTVLFTRSVNGLSPTEFARSLAEPARAMARASEVFVRTASASAGGVSGTVRVSVADMVGIELLPRMLVGLRSEDANIAVEISLDNAAADVVEQEVDIAVRMYAPSQSSLVAQKVGSIPLGFFAHADYVARKGEPKSLDDLAHHDLIGPDRSKRDLDMAAQLSPLLVREHFVMRTDSHPAQLALARAGHGIVVVHQAIGMADPDLVQLLAETSLPPIETWIVMHEDLRDVPRVRAVFDHLVAAFRRYTRND